MHLRGKTLKLRVVVFGVLMNYHCNLFYLNMKFSIIFPYCFESRRGVIERCFLPGIAETTGVRWRGQGQGEKIYKLILWICMNCLDVTWVLHCVAVRPLMWILETLNFQVLLTSCHPLCSLQALEAFTDKLQRQLAEAGKKERGKVPLRLHTLHQMIITIIAQTQLHEIQSCLLMQPLLFCWDFVIQDRAGLLPMLFFRPRAHQRLWKNSLRASQATKCPSVVSLDKEHHILVPI